MNSDLSLIEISSEDDSLIRLDDPSDDIFPCSPVAVAKSAQTDANPDLSPAGGVTSVGFNEKIGESSSKENIDVKVEGMKLNVDTLKMKRRKKEAYNLRKSLAWNKAFFTEEGVLDPEELSLVTGIYNLPSKEQLSTIQEEKRKPNKSCSPHLHSIKEKLSMKSPGLRRGTSPSCDSSTRYRVSPAKEITSPQVRRLVLSPRDTNRKGEKHDGCPRPPPSSSYKRPATSSASRALSKEPKLAKSSVPRAGHCSLPKVPRIALPKASGSSGIPGAEAKRVISATKSAVVALKGPTINARGGKGSLTNVGGLKSLGKSVSSAKPSPSKESSQRQGGNKCKLPPRIPAPRNPQVPRVSELDNASAGVPKQVGQQHSGNNKHNSIPLPQKCSLNDSQKEIPHVQAGKPTGLRVPSPSLGYFSQPKQSGSLGNKHLRNISDVTAYSDGARNVSVAQGTLQVAAKVPGVTNGIRADDESMCFSSKVREPLLMKKPVEIESSTKASDSSPLVQADFVNILQTLPHDAGEGLKPSAANKCDERADMKESHTNGNGRDTDRSYHDQPKCVAHQGELNNSCRKDLEDILSFKGYCLSDAENKGCNGIHTMTHDAQRNTLDNDRLSVEETETRKTDSGEAHLKERKESLHGSIDYDASSPPLKCGGNEGVFPYACKGDLKDNTSYESCSSFEAKPQDYGAHTQPLTHDNERRLPSGDGLSLEGTEMRKPDFSEPRQENYKDNLYSDTNFDPSPQRKSPVLDTKENFYLTDSSVNHDLSELDKTCCSSGSKHFIPATEDVVKEGISSNVHAYTPSLTNNLQSFGMWNGNSSRTLCVTTDEGQFAVSEMKATRTELHNLLSLKAQTCSSNTGQKISVHEEVDATSCSNVKDEQTSCVEVELLADCRMPCPESQVKDIKQFFSECGTGRHKNNKNDLVNISADFVGMVNEREPSYDRNGEVVLKQSSEQVTEHREVGSDNSLEEMKINELMNYSDLALSNSKSTDDHGGNSTLYGNNDSETVDGEEWRNPFSQLADLEKANVICVADVFTTKNHVELPPSNKCSLSETCHQNSSEVQYGMDDIGIADEWRNSVSQSIDLGKANATGEADASTTKNHVESFSLHKYSFSETCHQESSEVQYGRHDIGLGAVSHISREHQSIRRSTNLDESQLERNVTETITSEDDTMRIVEVEQHPCDGTGSNLKPANLVTKPLTNVVPFSDEWLAAIEAAGEDILTLKSGAVQHSPPDKSIPEPSPWSPVKRYKNQGIGPFDCTKHTSLPLPPGDD